MAFFLECRLRALVWMCGGLSLLLGCATEGGDASRKPAVAESEPQTAHAAAAAQPAAAAAQPLGAPEVTLLPPGREPVTVQVEVVQTPAARQRGLMYRKQLGAAEGMLFIFESARQQSFWMRNTYIPLDMLFIRPDMTVLGVVENAEPLTETPRQVQGASQYVLEVNAGFARRHGVGPGTLVRVHGVPALAKADDS